MYRVARPATRRPVKAAPMTEGTPRIMAVVRLGLVKKPRRLCLHSATAMVGRDTIWLAVPAIFNGNPIRYVRRGILYSPPATPQDPLMIPIPSPPSTEKASSRVDTPL